jgi:putative flippase GtrA
MSEFISQFIKFCVVGGSGVILDYGFTILCKEKLKFNKYVSNSIGFIIAASSNYLLNRIWTFKSENQNIPSEYLSFILVAVVGLMINNAVLWLLHGKLKYNFYLSKLAAIGVATFWNFLANYTFTFNKTINF